MLARKLGAKEMFHKYGVAMRVGERNKMSDEYLYSC